MSGIFSKSENKKKDPKISAILQEYASEYFGWGQDIDTKQSMLNLACNAWNIANQPEEKREQAIHICMAAYKQANPFIDDAGDAEHDLRKLVEKKLEKYDYDRRPIVSAQIVIEDGKEVLIAATVKRDG